MAMTFGAGVPKSGMMEIGIALVLHDRFSNQAGQASAAIKKLQTDARLAVQSNLQTASSLGMMGVGAFTAIASGVRDMIQYGAEFVDTMVTVEAITDATTEQMNAMNDLALTLGKQTMFSSQDIASGMKYLAMAGNSAKEVQEMISGAAYAAGATGLALGGKGGAADVITNVMRTFQLAGKEAAMWVGDVMTNATLSANISMTDLAASIRYAAADMTNLGYRLPEVSAAIGTLGNMGIQGSMAGTALANMARYLNRSISDPSYKGHKLLQSIGLDKESLTNADGSLKSLYEIITMIKDASANMDPTERNLLTTGIFGVRGNRAAMALMRDTEGFMKLYNDLMGTGEGYAQSIVEKRMETIAGQLNVVKSTWENLKATFAKSMSGFFVPIFKMVTKYLENLRNFVSTGFGRFVTGIGLITTALIGVAGALITIRSRFMMLRTDSTVSARNMFAVLMGGWKGAKLEALKYAEIERMILTQRRIGIGGKLATVMAGGRYSPVYGKDGKTIIQYRDHTTGRFASKKTFGDYAKTFGGIGAGAAVTATLGKGVNKAVPILGRLVGIGGKFLGWLTGPWGLLITTLASLILPGVIGALGKNKKSTEENQSSIEENTLAVNNLTNTYRAEAEKQAAQKDTVTIDQLKAAVGLLGQLLRGQKDKQPIAINIRMPDGSVQSFTEDDIDDMYDHSMN